MAKKKEDVIIDKKTKEKLAKDIYNEIEHDIKSQICNDVIESVKTSLDSEYIETIKKAIADEVTEDVKKLIHKEELKLLRKKNFKIFRMYIYIIILLLFSLFLCYRLYITGNLNFFKYQIVEKDDSNQNNNNYPINQEKDLAWYKEQYSYLIDNLKIKDTDILKGNSVISDLSPSNRLAIAYNNISEDKIQVDNIIYSFNEKDLIDSYKNIFGTDDYEAQNFSSLELNYAYSKSTQSYIAINDKKPNKNEIIYDIIDIKEENDELVITVSVAIIRDKKLYSIYNLDESISELTDEVNISKHREKLPKINFHFKKINGKYYIYSIMQK